MSSLLDKAIAELKTLPKDTQKAIASDILDLIVSERRWDKLFADPRSEKFLEKMTAEVQADIDAGNVIDGDPSTLRWDKINKFPFPRASRRRLG